MMRNNSCPISLQKIDSNISRIGAFFVVMLIMSYLYTSQMLFLYILAVDFFTRIYLNKSYSIFFQLSKLVKKILKLESNFTDDAPKKIAAKFGMLLSVVLIIGAIQNYQLLLNITISIFLFCATLELIFDCCIGCKLYYILPRKILS